MELPGESALFFKLALRFQRETASNFPMQYQARIAYAGFDQIKIVADLGCGGKSLASGQCWSYVRPPVPPIENADPTGVVPGSLAGKIAVITGVSRGLGAAIARALEVRGAIVYGISRSECELDASQVERGDAADPEISTQLRERILRKHGRLDYLICNASPPLLPLTLERNGANRIAAFIQSTIALTLFPLCELSDLLQRSDACLVIISSVAAESPVKEWPHYVAAKRAIEALGSVAVLQHPSLRTLIVRPEKLMTNLTNTPMGHVNAGSPKELARRLAERLEDPPAPGVVEILY
jgi:NAD(P)-dependent dehydrogenase (short-subunit alcohol dehydrogenase family)